MPRTSQAGGFCRGGPLPREINADCASEEIGNGRSLAASEGV